MENNIKEQTCHNCRYFLTHYIKYYNGKFLSTTFGHCVNRNLTIKQGEKILNKYKVCQYWESADIVIEKRKKSIFDNIEAIQLYLADVVQVLKDDLNQDKINE